MAAERVLRSGAKKLNGSSLPGVSVTKADHVSHGLMIGSRTSSKSSKVQKVDDVGQDSSEVEQISTPLRKKPRVASSPGDPNRRDSTTESIFLNRPAEPHSTNAPLKTPGGSRLITYPKEVADSSPSKSGIPKPTTTTSQLLDQACAHLIKVDSRLQPLIEKHRCHLFSAEGLAEEIDPFRSLCSSIMAQQVSGAAASSIKRKFIRLFETHGDAKATEEADGFPTPAQVAACEVSFLRSAGLSERKAEYIKGLSEKFTSGELSAAMLISASDEEILERLTAVRGLGRWSVEMFACFALKRTDILSTGPKDPLCSR